MRIRSKPWAKPELDACGFCIKTPEMLKGRWQEEFNNGKPVFLELGCGKGGFISKAASGDRDKNFIAVDIKNEMLVLAKRKIEAEYAEKGLSFDNIRIFIKNIEQINNIFSKEDRIERIYINFCNPWPKSKHKKRRLTHYRQLVKYKEFLNGELWFKTDDDALFRESFEYFERAGYKIKYKTYDLHESGFKENIITEHEQMFTAEGKKIKFLIAELGKQNEKEGESMGNIYKELIVDGSTADSGNTFKGIGIAADKDTLRILMDHKRGYPDSYKDIMDILFKPYYGAGISYIKTESGEDTPFSADAVKINSDIVSESINSGSSAEYSGASSAAMTREIIKKICQSGTEPVFYNIDRFIKTEQPWSGYYEVSDGLWAVAHITHFIGNDWKQVKSFDRGSENETHAAFMSDNGDYTLIFENSSDSSILYNINVLNTRNADSVIYCIESVKDEESGKYEWFRVIDKIIPDSIPNGSSYRIDVKAGSVLTCTTMSVEDVDGINSVKRSSYLYKHLELPYTDSFNYDDEFIADGNNIPVYTSGICGRYELEKYGDENILKHIADIDDAKDAVLCLGDRHWSNYSAGAEVMLENAFDGSYAGIGVRCIKNEDGTYTNGCELRLYSYGKWQLRCLGETAAEGTDCAIDASEWNKLKISVKRDVVVCAVNKQVVCNYKMSEPVIVSGYVSLTSSGHISRFRKLSVAPVSGVPCCSGHKSISDHNVRFDDNWNIGEGYADTETKNAVFEFGFGGDSAALVGKAENARLKVEIDDKISAAGSSVEKSGKNQVFYYRYGLSEGEHKIKVTVLSGKLSLYGIITDEKKRTSEKRPKRQGKTIDIELPRKDPYTNKLKLGVGLAAVGIGILILKKIFGKKKK